jgi:hypothetical protein
MEAFIDTLAAFERIHSWWSDKTFINPQNTTLRNFVQDTIRESSYIQELVTNGTTTEMDQFKAQLLEKCPKMIQAILMNLLDYLYTFDMAGKPFATDLVTWYRSQGWQFPNFSHE